MLWRVYKLFGLDSLLFLPWWQDLPSNLKVKGRLDFSSANFRFSGFVLSGRRFITFLTIFLLNGSSGISGLVAVKLETETDLQPLFATFIILTILITALVSENFCQTVCQTLKTWYLSVHGCYSWFRAWIQYFLTVSWLIPREIFIS